MRRHRKGKKVLSPASILRNFRETSLTSSLNSSQRLYQSLKSEPNAKVCVLRRVGGIGDVLMMTPALKELKARLPEIELTVGIDRHSTRGDVYYELLKNAPFIDELVDARYINRKKFSQCVDISAVCIPFEKKGFPSRNRIDLFSNYLGFQKVEDKVPFYNRTQEEIDIAKSFYQKNFNEFGPVIAIHTASNEKKRCWPLNQILSFIAYMKQEIPTIQFLMLDQNMICKEWSALKNVVPVYNSKIREMAALIGECDIFIGPDSGPMHLAGALKKKSVVVFGSVPPEARINHYALHRGVRMDELKCIGCWYSKCHYNYKCMTDLAGARVGKIAKEHLLGSLNEKK